MIFIQHRMNRLAELEKMNDSTLGAEIDLRSNANLLNSIHLAHDPWQKGDFFADWLDLWTKKAMKGPLILNTKEDGLESIAIELLRSKGIENYFFLDTTIPTLVKWAVREKNSNFAARVSSYETAENALLLKGKVKWIWADCFEGKPLDLAIIAKLKSAFQICLVAPELQGATDEPSSEFIAIFKQCDAICTKKPDEWRKINRS